MEIDYMAHVLAGDIAYTINPAHDTVTAHIIIDRTHGDEMCSPVIRGKTYCRDYCDTYSKAEYASDISGYKLIYCKKCFKSDRNSR